MRWRLSTMEARKRFGQLLEEVYHRGDEVVIERAGKPMAVMVPIHSYEQWQARRQAAMDRLFSLIEKNHEHNKGVPFEEIEAAVDEAVRAVRAASRKDQGSSY